MIAAPYVATPIALRPGGRTRCRTGSPICFDFAPPATEHHVIDPAPARPIAERQGFVEFGWQHLETHLGGLTRLELMDRTRRHLRALAKRRSGK